MWTVFSLICIILVPAVLVVIMTELSILYEKQVRIKDAKRRAEEIKAQNDELRNKPAVPKEQIVHHTVPSRLFVRKQKEFIKKSDSISTFNELEQMWKDSEIIEIWAGDSPGEISTKKGNNVK